MKKLLLYCLLLFGLSVQAQSTNTPLAGTVIDAHTQAAVPFASLAVLGQPGGAVSNAEGAFRLTLPSEGDSVRVQALGYAPLKLALRPLLAASAVVLRLQPQTYQLQEVTVTALTPLALLRQAARRTTATMASPVGLAAYYREFTVFRGEVNKFADALVDYYIQTNPRRPGNPQVQARVPQLRVGQAPLSREDSYRALPSPFSIDVLVGSYYNVLHIDPCLDSLADKYYSYKVLEIPANAADAPYYEVRCTPITQDKNYLRETTIRIDRQTLTIRHVESAVPARLQAYTSGFSIFGMKMQQTQASQCVDYRELNGHLYPGFVRTQIVWDATKDGRLIRSEFISDMLVRDLAPTAAPIPKGEQYSGPLYKSVTHYTRPYWREGNVVPATKAEAAAIEFLSKDDAVH